MMIYMLYPRHNLQIFNSIVQFIAVNMVNYLRASKFTTQTLLHDITMFKIPPSLHADYVVSPIINMTALISGMIVAEPDTTSRVRGGSNFNFVISKHPSDSGRRAPKLLGKIFGAIWFTKLIEPTNFFLDIWHKFLLHRLIIAKGNGLNNRSV